MYCEPIELSRSFVFFKSKYYTIVEGLPRKNFFCKPVSQCFSCEIHNHFLFDLYVLTLSGESLEAQTS